jgi:RNA polymerase sigma-70 factor (ECF subfamily)
VQLTGEERELVALRYVEGLSYAEIAEALGVPVGTVKWRMFHIKSKCAAMARAGGGVLA